STRPRKPLWPLPPSGRMAADINTLADIINSNLAWSHDFWSGRAVPPSGSTQEGPMARKPRWITWIASSIRALFADSVCVARRHNHEPDHSADHEQGERARGAHFARQVDRSADRARAAVAG